jgi:hypothetical protein
MSTNTTLESIPGTSAGRIAATRKRTGRSPANATNGRPAAKPYRFATRADTIAPLPAMSTSGSTPFAAPATSPGRLALVEPPCGSGRSVSIPSTRRISPENGSPACGPATIESSIAGLA